MNDAGPCLCWCGLTHDWAASVFPRLELEMCLKVTVHLQSPCRGLDWSRWSVCLSVCVYACAYPCIIMGVLLSLHPAARFVCVCERGRETGGGGRYWAPIVPTRLVPVASFMQSSSGCVWHFILLPILCCSRTKNIAMVTALEANETGRSVGRVAMNRPIRWNCLSVPPVPFLYKRCA